MPRPLLLGCRRHSLDDTDLVALGLLETSQRRQLDDFTSPSTKLLIATLHSLSLDQKNQIQLSQQRQLPPPTETIDLQASEAAPGTWRGVARHSAAWPLEAAARAG